MNPVRTFKLWAFVVVALGLAKGAIAQYVVEIDVGTLGGDFCSAVAVNKNGQVVGSGDVPLSTHAFSWTPDGGIVDLGGPETYATAVNDNGQIVGWGFDSDALLWEPTGEVVHLGSLEPGVGGSRAWAVNNSGQVVGDATNRFSLYNAFSWTAANGMVELSLGNCLGCGSDDIGAAWAVNESGQVVGSDHLDIFTRHAYSWTAAGGMVDLGTLGGRDSAAVDVNDNGQVVGSSATAGDFGHAFSWSATGGMVDLGTLGGSRSEAVAVNNSGQVVGYSSIAGDVAAHAFLWTATGGMVDLGTLGGSLSVATAMNNRGQVVGYSSIAGDVASHAFSWTAAGGMVDLGTVGNTNNSRANAVNDLGEVVGSTSTAPGKGHATMWVVLDSPENVRLATNLLAAQVQSLGLSRGLTTALSVTLQAAIADLDNSQQTAAGSVLGAFLNQVDAFRAGRRLTDAQANGLTTIAQAIVNAITIGAEL